MASSDGSIAIFTLLFTPPLYALPWIVLLCVAVTLKPILLAQALYCSMCDIQRAGYLHLLYDNLHPAYCLNCKSSAFSVFLSTTYN